ncbi:hypothetical protein, partial [Trebonia sp.]|uniref:hypothetical protein n=1 Tax=Trebonia sp. TaxID=2767075 RepID=UPI002606DBE7
RYSTPSAGSTPSVAPAAESPGPSSALVGCVLNLTGGVTPSLVDLATYQGEPAYVIAVPSRAWVVGLGCTASRPELITTVSLAAAR